MPAQHILVPIDFSTSSDHALDYAMTLARALQARLTLLHVIEPFVVGSVETLPYTYIQDLEAKITDIMTSYRERVTVAGSRVTSLWCTGYRFRSSLRRPARPMST